LPILRTTEKGGGNEAKGNHIKENDREFLNFKGRHRLYCLSKVIDFECYILCSPIKAALI